MNLNQLKIFYAAAKLGNLSLAAKELFISQPAVTKGIQRLQAYYDVKLMNRFGKKLVLTDIGEVLYDVAEKIFYLEKLGEEKIRDFKQQKTGRIRIHAGESFGEYYFPTIMNPFSKANPWIQISVSIFPTSQVVENIASLKCDIGFISYPVENKKIFIREIVEDQLVLIVPPNHPFMKKKQLTPPDLEKEAMIVHEKESVPFRILHEFMDRNQVTIPINLQLSSNRAIKQAVESGLGVALISRKIVEEEIQSGRLSALPLPGPIIKRKYYLVHHKEKYISETLQSLIDQTELWAREYSGKIS